MCVYLAGVFLVFFVVDFPQVPFPILSPQPASHPPTPLPINLSVALLAVFLRDGPFWRPRSPRKRSTRQLGAPAPTLPCCPPLAGDGRGGRPACSDRCCQPPPPRPSPVRGGTPRARTGTHSEGLTGPPAAGSPTGCRRLGGPVPRGVQLQAPPTRATAGPQIAS